LKYKIVNPQAFRETVLDERGLKSKLESILESSLRQVIGKKPLNSMLTNERAAIMQEINDIINLQVSGKQQAIETAENKDGSKRTESRSDLGIEVIDVRIMRADLPKENSQAIYRRMQTEREKEAKQFRAEGEKEAKRIKAEADKTVTVMLANANRDAQILRGQGDAKATKIFAGAYNRDPDFFEFYRTLKSYAKGLSSDSTTMVMSTNSDFLKYLRNINGKKK
jgi:membrane protease subunit HflC